MAHIRKRTWPSGRVTYQAIWEDPDGNRKSKNFDLRGSAQDHLDEVCGDLIRGTYIDPDAGRQLLGAFADDEWAPAQDWDPATREAWENIRKRLERHTAILRAPLASIDQLMIKAARSSLRKRYAHSTTNHTIGWLGMILRAAHTNGRIPRNPADNLKPLVAREGEPDGVVRPEDVPSTEEVLAILAGAPPQWRAAIALGSTGLRRGEMLGLAVDRIDIDTRTIIIDRQLARLANRPLLKLPKRGKVRTIEVPPLVAVELRRHLRQHVDLERAFEGGGGPAVLLHQGRPGTTACVAPHSFYDSAWRPALKAAGLEEDRYTFHALRHFAASSLLAAGADVATVAGHLGDTVEVVSRTYAHWMTENRGVPAAILERVLAPQAAPAVAR